MSKKAFTELIAWSLNHYHQLPWRKDRSLYTTLVSEIMLQQTTVGTVLNHYDKFLERFPTINDLARASEEEVCVAWKGLGYYRRARSLRNLAIAIVEVYDGIIPTKIDELMKLKGIGPYTANALVAIGADQKGLAVDANLERVLARFYGYQELKGAKLQSQILKDFSEQKILKDISKLSPRAVNESLMDLGRVICQARKASCSLCPLNAECLAFKSGKPESFPLSAINKKAVDHELDLLRVVVQRKNKILFYQKQSDEWLSGQWELPTFILKTSDKKLSQYPPISTKKAFENLPVVKTGITKYKINNYILALSLDEFQRLINYQRDYCFKELDKNLNLSTASSKALKKLQIVY